MALISKALGYVRIKLGVHFPNLGRLPYDECRNAIDGVIDLFAGRADDDVVDGKEDAYGQGYRYGQTAEG